VPKLIKQALVVADLTKKLDESHLVSSPMCQSTISKIEKMCNLPDIGASNPMNPQQPQQVTNAIATYHPILDSVKLGQPLLASDIFPNSDEEVEDIHDEELLDYDPTRMTPKEDTPADKDDPLEEEMVDFEASPEHGKESLEAPPDLESCFCCLKSLGALSPFVILC
jgi:hypothetical protein